MPQTDAPLARTHCAHLPHFRWYTKVRMLRPGWRLLCSWERARTWWAPTPDSKNVEITCSLPTSPEVRSSCRRTSKLPVLLLPQPVSIHYCHSAQAESPAEQIINNTNFKMSHGLTSGFLVSRNDWKTTVPTIQPKKCAGIITVIIFLLGEMRPDKNNKYIRHIDKWLQMEMSPNKLSAMRTGRRGNVLGRSGKFLWSICAKRALINV